MVSGIKKNPALLRSAGDFKVAAELLGIQAKGLGGITGSLPAMFEAAQVKMPQEADATEPQELVLEDFWRKLVSLSGAGFPPIVL